MNAFFEELGSAFAAEAKACGASIDAPSLEANTAEELLKLASVVAHTRERRFAPLACYVAGIAAARAQAQNARIDLTKFIETVRLTYQPQEDSSGING